MPHHDTYVDLKGREYPLQDLSPEERQLVAELQQQAQRLDWNAFDNYWMSRVAEFYSNRGLTRKASKETLAFRIAQDLSSRLALTAGFARLPDYRDELERLVRRFKTQRAFCEATGLAEDLLSHVLARRKHLSLETLTDALNRIGYDLRIVPREQSSKEPVAV